MTLSVRMTNPGSPEMYDVYVGDEFAGYMRLLDGTLTAFAYHGGEWSTVYETETLGWGFFAPDEKRGCIDAATLAIQTARRG